MVPVINGYSVLLNFQSNRSPVQVLIKENKNEISSSALLFESTE